MRMSRVINDSLKLPRPKVVYKVMHIGHEIECEIMRDELALLPENQSTEDIEVVLWSTKFVGQKDSTSYRPGNGSR